MPCPVILFGEAYGHWRLSGSFALHLAKFRNEKKEQYSGFTVKILGDIAKDMKLKLKGARRKQMLLNAIVEQRCSLSVSFT